MGSSCKMQASFFDPANFDASEVTSLELNFDPNAGNYAITKEMWEIDYTQDATYAFLKKLPSLKVVSMNWTRAEIPNMVSAFRNLDNVFERINICIYMKPMKQNFNLILESNISCYAKEIMVRANC